MTDDALTPDEAAMLADALDLEHGGDLVYLANGIMKNTHKPGQCANDDACWVHSPSDHPLNTAPVHFDGRLAWRECPEHGQLHPDPDALAYATRGVTRYAGREPRETDIGYHPTCCGCCLDHDEGERWLWAECGAGWHPLLDRAAAEMAAIAPAAVIERAKRKWGVLRVEWDEHSLDPAARAAVERVVARAEEDSKSICEQCGQPSIPHGGPSAYSLTTICEACSVQTPPEEDRDG